MTSGQPPSGAPTLVLIPTELERRAFERAGGLPAGLGLLALCGFGPVLAAARTAALLERLRPRRVLLVGIAGAYDLERDPLESARLFGSVAVDGLGAGEGPARRGPSALGLPQWAGGEGAGAGRIEERLPLARPHDLASDHVRAELLTVCAAAEGEAMADERRRRFPAAAAEDMEAFAVAAACALSGTPAACVRGISNRVGDRDHRRWAIEGALAAARALALEALRLEAWSQTATGR